MTREEWLERAVNAMRPWFEGIGHPITHPVKCSCSWPHKGGIGNSRGRTRGQCWARKASVDGTNQVFISPMEDRPKIVLQILAHELVHAIDDCEHGHRKPFQVIAGKLGFGKPFTCSDNIDIELTCKLEALAEQLGDYPHGRLNPKLKPNTQTTRLIKAECATCGYTVRVTKKWLEVGAPHCPHHGEMVTDQDGE